MGIRIIVLCLAIRHSLSMIVYDLNLARFTLDPGEADAIPVVDADTVLTSPFTLESLKLVAGRYPQLLQGAYRVELIEFPYCHTPQIPWTSASCIGRVQAVEHVLSPGTLERPYHVSMIARDPC